MNNIAIQYRDTSLISLYRRYRLHADHIAAALLVHRTQILSRLPYTRLAFSRCRLMGLMYCITNASPKSVCVCGKCVCVDICLCMRVCVDICLYASVWTTVCVYVQLCFCLCVVCLCVCVNICVYTHRQMFITIG